MTADLILAAITLALFIAGLAILFSRMILAPANAIAMVVAFALTIVMFGVTLGHILSPASVIAFAVIGVALITLIVRAVSRAGRLPTDFAGAFGGVAIAFGLMVLFVIPMVITALAVHL